MLARLAALFPADATQASLKFRGIGTLVGLSVKRRSKSDFRLQFNEPQARFNVRLRDPAAFCENIGQVLSRYGHLPPIARADAEQKFLAARTNRFTRFFARIAVHLDPSHGSSILDSIELLNEKKHRVWIDVRQRAGVTFLTVGARTTSKGPRASVHAFVEIAALRAFHARLVSLRTA
jgi:hypothetical protein